MGLRPTKGHEDALWKIRLAGVFNGAGASAHPRDILVVSTRPHPGERFHHVRTFKMGDHQA